MPIVRIYGLTDLGTRLARNTQNPDTLPYKIVHFLDFNGATSTDRIADGVGENYGTVHSTLLKLSHPDVGVVKELTPMQG